MNINHHRQAQDSSAEQADHWLVLLHSPLFDRKQQRAFQQWLAASPENRLALQKSQAFWQKMGTLSTEQVVLLEQRLTKASEPVNQDKPMFYPARVWLIPAMICLLLLVIPGFQFWQGYFADYRTGTGEQRLIRLSDGSSVLLNTESALSVDYSQHRRSVILHGGEAHFKVAKDAARLFEVETAIGQVRALGTAFDVRQQDEKMTVTVLEHSVRVAFKNSETIERLQEGEQVSFNYLKNKSSAIETVNLKQAMAWQQNRLVFKDQPLQQVVAELARYRAGKIIIVDSALAKHQVTGVFDATDTEAALHTIEKSLLLKEFRMTDRLVFLSKL
jgi:transmembrane sensor